MTIQAECWDREIAVEQVGDKSFRMYVKRPHRLDELMGFADAWQDRICLIQGTREVSFIRLRNACTAKGHDLLAAGVKPGDHVFIIGWNSPDWVMNYWACLLIGAVPVLANAWWSDVEMSDALELVQPVLVLADPRAAARVEAAGPWAIGAWACDENVAATTSDDGAPINIDMPSRDENDPAAIIFTSGTSGRPKAVQLAHRSLLANQLMILHVTRNLPYRPDPAAGDVGLHTGPLFHIGGLHAMHRMVLVGNTLVFGSGRFNAGETLELIERHRIVRWSAVPTMATRVLEHPDLATRDVSSLTAMTLGGSAITADFIARVRAGLPSVEARIATGYGLSENGGQATTASGKDTARKPGATGRAMPLVEMITRPVPGLPDGEVLVRSPTQMLRYFGQDDSPIDAEGWLHTGDLGRVDEEGFLWITGRSKEIIIRGGENIAPAAVEEALSVIPGVVEAKVFGVPHPEFGEEVAAAVFTDGSMTADGLRDQLRERLASFSIPTKWLLLDSPLPVNLTGKTDVAAIRAMLDA